MMLEALRFQASIISLTTLVAQVALIVMTAMVLMIVGVLTTECLVSGVLELALVLFLTELQTQLVTEKLLVKQATLVLLGQ